MLLRDGARWQTALTVYSQGNDVIVGGSAAALGCDCATSQAGPLWCHRAVDAGASVSACSGDIPWEDRRSWKVCGRPCEVSDERSSGWLSVPSSDSQRAPFPTAFRGRGPL